MTLLCGMGAISTFFEAFPLLPFVFFAGILVLVGIAYTHGSFAMKRIGITTELSAILIFWIGVLVGLEEAILAVILTIFLASLNAFKEKLHGFVGTLNEKEWVGALQLLIISGAILPFLPHEPIDPWGVLVPFRVWLLVILISGIGFMGYFLIKYFGTKGGVPLTGFLGALVSSNAVTVSMASQSKKFKICGIFATGILIGLATMQLRVVLEILILGTAQLTSSIISIPIAMATASGIAAFYFFRQTSKKNYFFWEKEPELKLESPFELKPALQFGIIFVLVLFAVVFGKKYFGEPGVYLASLFSGIIDIDAIVLSTLESVRLGELDPHTAKNSIAIALFTNTIIKIGFVALLGSKELLEKITTGVLFITLIGVLTLFLT